MFNVDLIDLPKLTRIDGDVRVYETPTGEKYPSVTTVLSKTKDQSHLIAWRKRIGEQEAARKTARAASRGTATHLLCEKLVLNEPIDLTNEMPLSVHLFKQLERFLVANVNNIRVSEGSLFSHNLRVAGSVDLVANYRNHAAIIDFKTSEKNKKPQWVEDYFMQAAMYSFMLWEMTKMYHPKLVVAIGVEEEMDAQIFVEDVNDWLDKAKDRCARYHAINR